MSVSDDDKSKEQLMKLIQTIKRTQATVDRLEKAVKEEDPPHISEADQIRQDLKSAGKLLKEAMDSLARDLNAMRENPTTDDLL